MLADCGFGGWGEDDFGQFFGFAQVFRQPDAADFACGLVGFPAAAADVAAHHGFYFDGGKPFGDNSAGCDGLGFGFGQDVVHSLPCEVVGHDVGEFAEPEIGDLGEDFAFAGDGFVENDVKGGEAVAGDDEHGLAVYFV